MDSSWSAPDPHRVVPGTSLGAPLVHVEPATPPRRLDLAAAALTLALTVAAGAPVGLLWAALAPRAQAALTGGQYLRADPNSDAYIAADGCFFFAGVVAGLATGLLAWWLGRRHGPAVVPALAVGGLAAASLAQRVGEAVGLDALAEQVRSGAEQVDITLQLGALPALAGWPAAALLTHLAATLLHRPSAEADRAAGELG